MNRFIVLDPRGRSRGGVECSAAFARRFEARNPGWRMRWAGRS